VFWSINSSLLSEYNYFYDSDKRHIIVCMLTFPRAAAISNVPTVSILDAIIGIPWYVRLELRNVICRNKSTYNRKQNCTFFTLFFNTNRFRFYIRILCVTLTWARVFSVLLFGLSSTSLKSNFTSLIMFGMFSADDF